MYPLKLLKTCLSILLILNGGLLKAQQNEALPIEEVSTDTIVVAPIISTDTLASKKTRLSTFGKSAGFAVAGTGVWVATYVWVDEPLQKFAQQNRTRLGDGISHLMDPLGRQKYWGPISGGIYLSGFLLKNAKVQELGFISLNSLFLSGGFTTLIKNTTHRHRPGGNNKNNQFDWNDPYSTNTALPSAHTTVAFVMASSVSTVYGNTNKLVSPVAYGLATLVGLSRINENAHWATDVLAGAANGYLSVQATKYVYDFLNRKLNDSKLRLLIAPAGCLEAGSANATLVF